MNKNDLLGWYIKRYKNSSKEKSIYEKLRTIIAEQLGVDVAQVVSEASLMSDLGADLWLDYPELMRAFEDEFDIEISDEEGEEILTVKDAENYLLRSVSSEPKIEVTKALDKIAESLDKFTDLIRRHQVSKTDNIKSLLSEVSNIGLIKKRRRTKRIFNLFQELNITSRAEAIELIDSAMDHEYIAHSNKVEGLHSLLNSSASTAISELQSKHTDFTQQLILLLIERAEEEKKKKEKRARITREIEKLRSSLAELE